MNKHYKKHQVLNMKTFQNIKINIRLKIHFDNKN